MKIHYTLLVGMISISLLIPAYGHGTGIESSPFVNVNDRDIRVTVENLLLDNESDTKFFQIHAYDRTNKTTIENITFDVNLFKDDQLLLSGNFFEQEGLLVLDLNTDESGIFTFFTTSPFIPSGYPGNCSPADCETFARPFETQFGTSPLSAEFGL